MSPTIVYDTEEETRRAGLLKFNLVVADLDPDNDKRIAVWLPGGQNKKYHPDVVKIGELSGHWDKKRERYWVPLTLLNYRELDRYFRQRLEPSEALDDWYWDTKEEIESLENLSTAASDAELSSRFAKEAPVIARMAHAYQRAGIAFGAKTRRFGLFDQPGLGKTLQAAGVMVEADVRGDILVFAPSAAVAITWPDELGRWLPDDEVIVVTGSKPRREKLISQALETEPAGKRRWFILNLEMGRAEWIKGGREFRYPKVGKGSKNSDAPEKKWFDVPGWWDYKYPALFGDFKVKEVQEKWIVDLETKQRKKLKETFEFLVEKPPWAAIVVDESHRALISSKTFAWQQTQIRAGMGLLPMVEDGVKIAMSGTPMRGKPQNLWGTLNFLYPERYKVNGDWVDRWFDVVTINAGSQDEERLVGDLDETKITEFYEDIKPYMLRRTKKEVRAELPDKLYAGTPLPDEDGLIHDHSPVGHWLEMSPKQAGVYAQIVEDAEARLESGILVANGRLAELTRLKQFASSYGDLETYIDKKGDTQYRFKPQLPSNKFDWIVEFLDDLGINKNSTMELEEDGEEEIRKVVIASQFTTLINLFSAELEKRGIPTLKITGQVSTAERKRAAHRWQQPGGPRVFLLNTMAGGVALTLDAADDLIMTDETWIPDEQEQVEDRIHRVSRLHQVTIHYLRSKGTVEENIALTTSNRERLTKAILDEERGVSIIKKLLTPIKRPSA